MTTTLLAKSPSPNASTEATTSTTVVSIIPLRKPDETLREGFSERPNLSLAANSALVLGRNTATGIGDAFLSRRACVLRWTKQEELYCEDIKSRVWVNGKEHSGAPIRLQHGDELQLADGPKAYSYRIEMVASSDVAATPRKRKRAPSTLTSPPTVSRGSRNTAATAAAVKQEATNIVILEIDDDGEEDEASDSKPAAVSTYSSPNNAGRAPSPDIISSILPKHVIDEFYCPVCLDLQVQSMLIVPCGHSFCQVCCSGSSRKCPTCRGPLQDLVPNRAIDNMLSCWVKIKEKTIFPADDVASYHSRQPKKPPPSAVGTRRSARSSAARASSRLHRLSRQRSSSNRGRSPRRARVVVATHAAAPREREAEEPTPSRRSNRRQQRQSGRSPSVVADAVARSPTIAAPTINPASLLVQPQPQPQQLHNPLYPVGLSRLLEQAFGLPPQPVAVNLGTATTITTTGASADDAISID